MPFNRQAAAPERHSDDKSNEWTASLIAPDGREIRETFEGSRNDRDAWNRAVAYLMHDALPQMHQASGADGLCSMTERARSRFSDALLSQDGEIAVVCDPWQMHLTHSSNPAENSTPAAAAASTVAAFGFLAALGSSNPFM